MSHIISEWLNKYVGLAEKTTPEGLDDYFSSGYAFGELLSKYDLIKGDYQHVFTSSSTIDGVVRNYCQLEKALREKLGIKITSTDAHELVQKKSGTAARLLYEIKRALEKNLYSPYHKLNGQKKRAVSSKKGRHMENLADDPRLFSYPTSPVDGQSQKLPNLYSEINPKIKFNEKEQVFFESMLMSKLKRVTDLSDPVKVLKKEENVSKLSETVHSASGKKITIYQQPLCITPEPQVPKIADESRALPRIVVNTQFDLAIQKRKQAAAEKTSKAVADKQQKIMTNLNREINSFEQTIKINSKTIGDITQDDLMEDLGVFSAVDLSSPAHQAETNDIKHFLALKSTMDPKAHVKSLMRQLPRQKEREAQTKQHIEKIKTKIVDEDLSRKEREQRRRKIMLGQRQAQQELESRQLEELMLAKLKRQSKQEQRIAEQLMQVRHEKEVMIENRRVREQQYLERRQKDYEEAVEREFILGEQARKEYNEASATLLEQHFNILARKKEAKHQRNVKECEAMVHNLIDISAKISEYRTLNYGNEPPRKFVSELKTLFVHGISFQNREPLLPAEEDRITEVKIESTHPASDSPVPEEYSNVPESVKLIDEKDLKDYLIGFNEWTFGSQDGLVAETSKKAQNFAKILENIISCSTPEDEPAPTINFPLHTLKIVLVGKKFSGKKSLAKTIADKIGINLLDVDALISEHAAENLATNRKAAKGNQSKNRPIQNGGALDDETLVDLVLKKIRSLKEHIEVAEKGWIVPDFPRNRTQAQLFEKGLSGYEEPKLVKVGDFKRTVKGAPGTTTEKERARSAHKGQSQIAPPPADAQNATTTPAILPSGFDMVLFMDANNETCFSRATGRRLDPVTGIVYHLELNPPPTDVPGLFDRLVNVDDQGHSSSQLQYQINSFEEQQEPIKEWYKRFGTLQEINSNASFDLVANITVNMLKALGEKKLKEAAELEAAKVTSTPIQESSLPLQVDSSSARSPTSEAHNSGNLLLEPLAVHIASSSHAVLDSRGPGTAAVTRLPSAAAHKESTQLKSKISKPMAIILMDQWSTVEGSYCETMKFCFRALRRNRDDMIQFFYRMKEDFKMFLSRPDSKQALLDAFQADFNAIEEDLRYDQDTKEELHQRSDDLRDRLWAMSDQRKQEADKERQGLIEEKWIEEYALIIMNIYIAMAQAELDRFACTKQIALDYFRDLMNANVNPVNGPEFTKPKLPQIQTSAFDMGQYLTSLTKGPTLPVPTATRTVSSTNNSNKTSELTAVFETAIAFAGSENGPNNGATEKKDKKKGATEEQKTDEPEFCPEYLRIVAEEEALLRKRLEKLQKHSDHVFKELRTRGMEDFVAMQDWIETRFTNEMEAIKDVIFSIKEAVEDESKLPNQLILDGDKFRVDFTTLTYEPEPAPRPVTPVESQHEYSFTVLQLVNLARNFRQFVPRGVIAVNSFSDSLRRLASLSVGEERLPEAYMNVESNFLQKTVAEFDPTFTGYMNWKKFLFCKAEIPPLLTISEIKELFAGIKSTPSYNNGRISVADFLSLRLWFERNGSIDQSNSFNRLEKIKLLLAYIFNETNEPYKALVNEAEVKASDKSSIEYSAAVSFTSQMPSDPGLIMGTTFLGEHDKVPVPEGFVNVDEFLMNCAIATDQPIENAHFALALYQDDQGLASKEAIYKILKIWDVKLPDTQRFVTDVETDHSLMSMINAAFGEHEKISFEQLRPHLEGEGATGLDKYTAYFYLPRRPEIELIGNKPAAVISVRGSAILTAE